MDAVSKKTFPTINPQDESVIIQVAEGDKVCNKQLFLEKYKKEYTRIGDQEPNPA